MPEDEDDRTPAERLDDRVEALDTAQKSRVLYRLCARVPDAVNAVIDEFEATEWRWGE